MGAIHFSIDPELLALLRHETGAERFVETGTFEGRSLQIALGLFKECHSVEISRDYHLRAANQFSGEKGVHLALGSSPQFLQDNRRLFSSSPTIFWLDAHWCAAEHTADSSGQSPLMQELKAIGSLHPASTVMIDDARLYLAPPPHPHRVSEWPDLQDVVGILYGLSGNHRLMVLNDVILFYPESVAGSLRSYAVENGVDYHLQALRTPDLLPANKHLAQEAARLNDLYQRHRRSWYPWVLSPAAWSARLGRNKIRHQLNLPRN